MNFVLDIYQLCCDNNRPLLWQSKSLLAKNYSFPVIDNADVQ